MLPANFPARTSFGFLYGAIFYDNDAGKKNIYAFECL